MFDKIKFYGRRKGKKIGEGREFLLDNLLPKIAVKLPDEGDKITPSSLFDFSPDEVWLEVGFGGGEHLAEQSLNNPNIAFIGAEVFVNGVASLLAHIAGVHEDGNKIVEPEIAKNRTDNVRIYSDDVRQLFDYLPDACLDKIFVLFPDPWPKKRHTERRFIGEKNIPILARLLKKGGELRVASDDMGYIRHSLAHLNNSSLFEWTAESAEDWNNPPKDWVQTRYEKKALDAGKKPIYLIFKRI